MGWDTLVKQDPLLQKSVATGNYYIVTSYKKLEKGILARKKFEVTEAVYDLMLKALGRTQLEQCMLCGNKDEVVPFEANNPPSETEDTKRKFDFFLCNNCINISGVRSGM